jgi:hypothetical protein
MDRVYDCLEFGLAVLFLGPFIRRIKEGTMKPVMDRNRNRLRVVDDADDADDADDDTVLGSCSCVANTQNEGALK